MNDELHSMAGRQLRLIGRLYGRQERGLIGAETGQPASLQRRWGASWLASARTRRTLLTVGAAVAASSCFAQPAATSDSSIGQPTATATPPPSLRAWLLSGGGQTNLAIRLQSPSQQAGPQALATSEDGARAISPQYMPVPPGTALVELVTGERVLDSQTAVLQAGRNYTALYYHSGAGWQYKLFDDGPLKPNSGERLLRVLNFANGRAVQLGIAEKPQTAVAANSIQEFKVPPKPLGLSLKVLAADGGPPAESSTVADLSAESSAYLGVWPDPKGRLRPQILPGAPLVMIPQPPPPVPVVEVTPEQIKNQRIGSLKVDLDHHMAQLAVIEASEKGPNKIPNAEALKKSVTQKISQIRQQITAAEAAPVNNRTAAEAAGAVLQPSTAN